MKRLVLAIGLLLAVGVLLAFVGYAVVWIETDSNEHEIEVGETKRISSEEWKAGLGAYPEVLGYKLYKTPFVKVRFTRGTFPFVKADTLSRNTRWTVGERAY